MIGRLTKGLITMITSRKTRISVAIAAAAAAASIITLVGCGSAAPASAASEGGSAPVATAPAPVARPLDPVPILRQAGFKPDKGEVYEHAWAAGLEAEATINNANGNAIELISVYTSADDSAFQQGPQPVPGDDLGVVIIPAKRAEILVETYSDVNSGAPAQPAQPIAAQVALKVHGLVIEPQS
jgi:hypothetical protein